ncbi:MAG: HAMP domain-containing sensor histidine kinase [Terricaulis sp.]
MILGDRSAPNPRLREAHTLAALARARVSNVWIRLASCVLVALMAVTAVGDFTPMLWLAGLVPILLIDRVLFQRLLAECAKDAPPKQLWGLIAWTVFQTVYSGIIAAMMWFARYVHGETIAEIFMLAALANAAATLRGSWKLSLAAILPTIGFMFGLPLADYLLDWGRNPVELVPLAGALLFVGFGVNLWRSLRESDAAQARAELAAMRERQSAAAAAAAKSDTIKRMQDELRTPMQALIGAAEHLRRAAVSPEARMHIGALAQAGEVLRLVLGDLADLDRLENGQVSIDPQPCDPRDLARGVIGAFRAAAQDKNLELFLDISPDVPAMVVLDAGRVRQVLFNLIANAVKYTSHGGVRLRLQTQPSTQAGHVRLGFAIADTGAGMSRSQLALVFGRGRVCEEGEGPGLGLAISMRLARLMDAKLGAKSEVGEGSVFSLVFDVPVAGASVRDQSAA